MDGIHTLQEFMLRTESITYILIVIALILFPAIWKYLTERDED